MTLLLLGAGRIVKRVWTDAAMKLRDGDMTAAKLAECNIVCLVI